MKRIFSFQFLLLFNLVFSQIEDLGPLIDKYPDLQIHDSLSFFIHVGESSQIDYLLEGGALEIESESVISVTFSIINKRGQSISYSGNIFKDENSGTTFATFTNESKEELSQFSYTIIATELLQIKSVIGFLPDLEMIQITSRPMNMMDGDVPKPIIVSREEWGAEPPKYSYNNHPYIEVDASSCSLL